MLGVHGALRPPENSPRRLLFLLVRSCRRQTMAAEAAAAERRLAGGGDLGEHRWCWMRRTFLQPAGAVLLERDRNSLGEGRLGGKKSVPNSVDIVYIVWPAWITLHGVPKLVELGFVFSLWGGGSHQVVFGAHRIIPTLYRLAEPLGERASHSQKNASQDSWLEWQQRVCLFCSTTIGICIRYILNTCFCFVLFFP